MMSDGTTTIELERVTELADSATTMDLEQVAEREPVEYVGRHRAFENASLTGQTCPVRIRRQLAQIEADNEAAVAALISRAS